MAERLGCNYSEVLKFLIIFVFSFTYFLFLLDFSISLKEYKLGVYNH